MEIERSLYELPFSLIVDKASSKSHVPGGGSVSAMSAVLGASMASMVANLTLGKSGYEGCQEELRAFLVQLAEGIERVKALTIEDMVAFDSLLSAYRLPKQSQGQSEERSRAIQEGTKLAATIPLKIAEEATHILELNLRVSLIGNLSALSDSAVAAIILEAAARASMLSVNVNLASIKDPELKAAFESKRDHVLQEAGELMKETLLIVDNRQHGR
jgi:formiminotetrahydrofolate cyclodeaminase